MDFGDILAQWDNLQKSEKSQKLQKGQPSQTAQETAQTLHDVYEKKMKADSEKSANPMDIWMRRYGVIDKDAAAEEYEYRSKIESREYLRKMRPEEVIDLHGMTKDEAWQRLNGFVTECKRRGLHKILIIHGKGNHSHGTDPVLGEMVRSFIECDKRLGSSGHPDRNHGGSGATWVIIRQ